MKIGQKVKLGDLISVLTDYHANGSYEVLKKNVELLDDPSYALMIRTTNFEQDNFEDNKYINVNAYNFLKKSKVYPNDILMNKIANAGSVYLMPDLKRPVSLGMNLFLIRLNSDLVDPKYAYYYLKNNEKYIKLFANGAATSTITKEMVRRLDVFLPKISTQQKIEGIISDYNDLIDINRRRIQLLEESARLLFREWFVYFKFPNHEKVKIVDGVPEGWKKCLLGDFAKIRKGKNITFEQAIEGDIPVIGGGLGPTYYHNKANVSSPVITISASGANAGYVNLYDTDIWASDCSYINKNSTKYIFSLYLRLKSLQTAIFGYQVGAAQPHVYPKDLNRLKLLIATDDLCLQFEQLIEPMFNLIKSLKLENQKLAQARDLLLPRLMSGAIDPIRYDKLSNGVKV